MDRRPYCVVGAEPAGLAAARWLKALDTQFEGFERNAEVGGIWNIAFPGSPMYESAHFISSKTLSAFRDFPMPDTYSDYPSHRQVLRYIESYADRFDLRRHFQFGISVEAARPEGEVLHSRDYKHPRQFEGHRVLIVSGRNSGCDIACDASRAAAKTLITLSNYLKSRTYRAYLDGLLSSLRTG